ncbi:RNA-directed DNA polymerase, eukaryota [Tanacetum coccineum]
MGDFNEVRRMEERWGSTFNVNGARAFNNFISNSGLVDLQLEGYTFTWAHPSATKMSKLDRFLVTDGLLSLFPHVSAACLDRHLSDHRPILLREVFTDYGATPFRFYHSWFSFQGFEHMVTNTWNSTILNDSNRMIRFKKKLQILKKEIRVYVADQKKYTVGRVNDLNVKAVDARDSIQKAKIQWAVEGDENSKFFHGIVNRKQPNLAVKGCNSSFIALIPKSLDPKSVGDYRPISLIGSMYKVITKILATRLSVVISDLISDVQTAFLPNRQILDGPFIINELLARCHHKKQRAMVFKVDFAKAYDFIRWDYLEDVLHSFGFGSKWRSWIRGCLNSGMASILVNGSPTSEFQFHRGLKQGDPLAPYLFILVMESLHLSFTRVIEAGIFTGVRIDPSTMISHLFYADDVVFIGEWSQDNLKGIMHSLRCFSLLSGLSINIKKSHLLGVGIPASYVNFLTQWKLFDGTFFNGTQDDERKITWVKWTKVLASKKQGGLGVSSFYALNRALLVKWVWRFLSRDNSLWAQIIHAIHGLNGQELSTSHSSTWSSIVKEINILKTQECTVADKMAASFTSSFRRKVRGRAESLQLTQILDLLGTVILSNIEDRWIWDLNGDGEFCVKDVRNLLDVTFLPKADSPTRWIKTIPIKVNIFAWKVSLDRLPTRSNLARRGVLVPSSSCLICNVSDEDLAHLLFRCDLAIEVTRLVYRWWNLVWIPLDSYISWLSWIKALRMNSRSKSVLEGVFYTAWWSIWSYRNQILFSAKKPRKEVLFDDIVMRSFTWCIARSKNTFRWDSWLQHPYLLFL